MAFAEEWLRQRALFPKLIPEPPDERTGIIIVVPAFNEPGIAGLLNSIASCNEPGCRVEVLIIINAPQDADNDSLNNNIACIANIENWKNENRGCFFRTRFIDAGQPPIKGWGVGLARKTGMDEALRRFDAIDRPEGVIVSLDADCTVDKNYLVELCNELYKRKERQACSIRFEHTLSGGGLPEEVYRYAAMYELHMRYFYQAIKYSGHPYAFHTIGSAIACKAAAYLKAGGMNRKQAGEDFYFIQKLIPQGGYFELNSTTVYPSARTSERVPFGTGAVIAKMLDSSGGEFLTYNPGAFIDLHYFFRDIESLYGQAEGIANSSYSNLPDGIRSFILVEEWAEKIREIRSNTSSQNSFRKRFFGWFSMFRVIKYLNHVHPAMFEKQPVVTAAGEMLKIIGLKENPADLYELLQRYRRLEPGG